MATTTTTTSRRAQAARAGAGNPVRQALLDALTNDGQTVEQLLGWVRRVRPSAAEGHLREMLALLVRQERAHKTNLGARPARYASGPAPVRPLAAAPPPPVVQGRLYGGCGCGCTPRCVGYHVDPCRSWLSGPVLGCGRTRGAA